LPDAFTALQSKSRNLAAGAALIEDYFFSGAVMGTPPTLSSFDRNNGTARATFWRPGVVGSVAFGNPTPQQCSEFFNSPVDGESGGLGACFMAEGVGRTFETAIDAGSSVCQMQDFSSSLKINDRSLVFTKGKSLVPGGDLRKIFNTGEKERLVKIRVLNEPNESGGVENPIDIFIRIFSNSSNERRNLLYRAELYFCGDNQPTPAGFNSIQVLNNGRLKILNKDNREGGAAVVSLNGQTVTAGAALKWNLDTPRSGEVRFRGNAPGGTVDEKMGFSVSRDQIISRRFRRGTQGRLTREYTVASIVGSNAVDLRFLAGGFKNEIGTERSFTGSTEYRDPIYASAPSSELRARADSFDFNADPLFGELDPVSVDLSRYSCSAKPAISIVFDQSKLTKGKFGRCDARRLRRMNFCSGDPVVDQALNRQRTVCP
jgi:hypothetical protein